MDSTLRSVASPLPQRSVAVREAAPPPPLFAADGGSRADPLDREGGARLLAELALHRQAETPFCIGVLGGPGAGKSRFLAQFASAAEALVSAAQEAGVASSFEGESVVVRADVGVGDEPGTLLAAATFDRLAATHPALAAELRHAGDDPATIARRAGESLDTIRRRLDAERQELDALTGREARLVETVLDTPGSLVDSYARAKRTGIEGGFRPFGYASGDVVGNYKTLVGEAAQSARGRSQAALAFRALYAFRGQTRLIVGAVLLAAAAWGCAAIRADRDTWLGWISGLGNAGASTSTWLAAHLHWLGPIETVLLLGAVLLLLLNVVRAARFVLPITRGVDLLHQELEGRRRDMSSLIAHQTRRVDALASEAEATAEAASEAERRAGPRGASGALARPEALRASTSGFVTFFRALGAALQPRAERTTVPRRILLVVDGLDRRTPAEAAGLLAALRGLMGPGLVAAVVADPAALSSGFGETDPAGAAAWLARCIEVPYRLGVGEAAAQAWRSYAIALVEGGAPVAPLAPPDPSTSLLERAWLPREADTLAALAPFSGDTPRAIKRFVNLYRIARADPRLEGAARPVFTVLALALALDAHGFADDLSALSRATHGEVPGEAATLRRALAAARDASGELVELRDAQRGLAVASSYSGRL